MSLPGKSILRDYFQENRTSRRPFLSGRPNNVSVVNYLVLVVNYLAKTVPASDAPSAILAKTDCFGQITSVSAETVAFRWLAVQQQDKSPYQPCPVYNRIRNYFGQKGLFRPKETVLAKTEIVLSIELIGFCQNSVSQMNPTRFWCFGL